VDETLLSRDEVVGLLFTVNDVSLSLIRIEALLKDDDAEEDDES
jgi:hypothetical protein